MANVQAGERHILVVEPADAGTRLDKYLTEALGSKAADDENFDGELLSRARIKSLIDQGHVTRLVKNAPALTIDASYRVKEGESFTLDVPAARPARPAAQSIPLDVVYEDAELIVIMKPAGLVVHPAAGNHDNTLVNALIAHCGDTLSGIGGEKRPGIVHRLDKDTSGLMVVAKTDRAHRALSEQFAAHGRDGKLTRAYTALVWGAPRPHVGTIDANIVRSSHNRTKMATAKTAGRTAITHYKVLESFGTPIEVTLIECRLETGRTHQIRVHMTAMGHPLLGDATYGTGQRTRKAKIPDKAQAALERLGRQALHAHHLGFEHPVTGEQMNFDAPLPTDMQDLLDALKRG
ncbi:MAG: RluA family pseudouridine synthase [Parvibaculum sp.]